MDIFSSIIGETRVLREGTSTKKRKITKKPAKTLRESTKRVLREDDEVLAPVEDEVISVIDPEMEEDDTAELQELVDGAGEGEIPVADSYVDDHVYQCSICGNSFFSEDEITENPIVCPVCGEEANVVAQGVVEPIEGETDVADEPEEDAELEADLPEDKVEVVDDAAATEGFKRSRTAKRKVESARRARPTGYMFDDKKMSALVNNFFTENYKTVKSAKCVGASIAPTRSKAKTLTLECVLTLKNGKSRKVSFVAEGLILGAPKVAMRMTESTNLVSKKMHKAKTGKNPFVLECTIRGKVVSPTRLKYNFVIKEGTNLYRVSGSPRIVG